MTLIVDEGTATSDRHATFYLEDDSTAEEELKLTEKEKLVRLIDQSLIGKNQTFVGPFGRRQVIYCDYTASARSLTFIENYIRDEVLPLYGNTHSTIASTSMQSTYFREEARDILKDAVNASDDDVVLFAGSGCTGAVKKLIHALNLTAPPLVFVGPCEHDSNLLPWRELGSKIIRISETKDGILDLTDLQKKLEIHRATLQDEIMIGCFSAASNITGILTDDIATTILLHQFGALAVWDYATAAPYVNLDMNPLVPGIDQHSAHKDAMFFSGHKFIGGVQSTGILVAKKSLFTNHSLQESIEKTMCCTPRGSQKDTEFKEEAGTVAIVESIRAGMAMKLKQAVGVQTIMEDEGKIVKNVLSFIRKIPEITLLGSACHNVQRLAVFSIMVRHPRGSYLHHNFICAVLNDVFGIQARGGCACAGPYAQDLMGISKELASHFEEVLTEDKLDCDHQLHNEDPHSRNEMLRPGFTRLSFPYFMPEDEVAFVLEALKMVATEGWKLLPQYVLNPETGEWRHNSNVMYRERKRLAFIKFSDGKMIVNERKSSSVCPCPTDSSDCLRTARSIFSRARKIAKRHPLANHSPSFNKDLNSLRWFMLPSEAQDLLLGQSRNVKQDVPFCPSTYLGSRPHAAVPLDMKRHHSLIVDSEYNSKSDFKLLRQRSESNSPARNGLFKPLAHLPPRERCYSLGSAMHNEIPHKLPLTRQRLLSFGSQADCTDSETSTPSENDSRVDISFRQTPDLVYVEGVTKELATEIKSEIRDIIAQVDDVLLDNSSETDSINGEKRSSIDLQRFSKWKMNSLPTPSNIASQNSSNTLLSSSSQSSFCSSSSQINGAISTTISAERFSEYLVGFASEVVSEMKSEFRDVVNVVDGIVSPQVDYAKTNSESKLSAGSPFSSVISNCASKPIDIKSPKLCKRARNLLDLQCSQDSGINMTDRDLSPPEIVDVDANLVACKNSGQDKSNRKVSKTKLPTTTVYQWLCPAKSVWKPTVEALREFDMIRNGDKVLVCLSGGKDSLTLLHALHQYQHYCAPQGIKFKVGVATIGVGSSEHFTKTLLPYLNALGVEHFFEEADTGLGSSNPNQKSFCTLCSHVKRGKLYKIARKNGYNVLALGQHLDDVSESFFMSVFHNGYLRTMKAHYVIREEDLRVIRPMIYVREESLRHFAETRKLPFTNQKCSTCPVVPKERDRVKDLLALQERLFPQLFLSIKSALKPLISLRYTGLESNDARMSWKSSHSDGDEQNVLP